MHKNHILQNLYTKIQILCNQVQISFIVLQPHTSNVQCTTITYIKIPHPCMPEGLKVVPTLKRETMKNQAILHKSNSIFLSLTT